MEAKNIEWNWKHQTYPVVMNVEREKYPVSMNCKGCGGLRVSDNRYMPFKHEKGCRWHKEI